MGLTLPMDIFVHIVEFVDDLKDLLAFASTSRALHALIVPRHSDYRRIVCAESATHVWEHLLTTSKSCSYVRYLKTTTTHNLRTNIPRLCPIDWDFAVNSSLHLNFGTPLPQVVVDKDCFLQTLSKMVNLKILAFETAGQGQIPIGAISEAIEKAGCELEEIDVYFNAEDEESLDLVDEGNMFVRYFEENKYPENPRGFSLLYDYLPSLRKYFIYGNTVPDSNVFLQMLLNAPNLTHINVTQVWSTVFLLGYWPNLQHLVVYPCDTLKDDPLRRDYTPGIRMFFSRHSKLITLRAEYALIPGWAIESDSFLPNLRSLGITRLTSETPMMTFHIGTRLTHVDMNTALCSHLKDNGIVLYNLESCRYWNADPRASTQDLVDIIPNIKKLYMLFGYYQGTNRLLTADEIMERIAPFSGFKSLRILIGLFDAIDIDDHLLESLYSMPSLVYTRVRDKHSSGRSLLRLERDNIAGAVKYELMKVLPDECDMRSWGGFYRRDIHISAERFR